MSNCKKYQIYWCFWQIFTFFCSLPYSLFTQSPFANLHCHSCWYYSSTRICSTGCYQVGNSSGILTLTFNSVTVQHHKISPCCTFAYFMPTASLAPKNLFKTASLVVLAQACVSWPIRADLAFRRRGLKETGKKTECSTQRGNTLTKQKCFCKDLSM